MNLQKATCINASCMTRIIEGATYLVDTEQTSVGFYDVYDMGGALIAPYSTHRFKLKHGSVGVPPVAPLAPPAPTVSGGTGVGTGMKYDGGKPRMDLLLDGCPAALLQVAEVLTFGAKKYAAHSWHTVSEGKTRYKAALLRHLTAHAQGEVNDPESGLPHLAHAACCSLFILELEQRESK